MIYQIRLADEMLVQNSETYSKQNALSATIDLMLFGLLTVDNMK